MLGCIPWTVRAGSSICAKVESSGSGQIVSFCDGQDSVIHESLECGIQQTPFIFRLREFLLAICNKVLEEPGVSLMDFLECFDSREHDGFFPIEHFINQFFGQLFCQRVGGDQGAYCPLVVSEQEKAFDVQ